ncbi:AAA family ATPase [Halorhabdus tiamatea]|nr:AAA family ATPase [Halorhabdus tiamatea]
MSEGEVGMDENETASPTIRDRIEQANENAGTMSVFKNPDLLDPNYVVDSDRIVGRDEQLDGVISVLREALNGSRPRNMLLFGGSGTGKSLITKAVSEEIETMCDTQDISFGMIYLQCQNVDTFDRAIFELVQNAAAKVNVDPRVPKKGISAKAKFDRLFEIIDDHYDITLFALDEIDKLRGSSGSEPAFSKLLYQLTRAGPQGNIDTKVSVAALSNDVQFMHELDGRAESSFDPEDIHFGDYDAGEIRDILNHRKDAFKSGALGEGVIPLSGALCGQNNGDARKAINLLWEAGKLADQEGDGQIEQEHLRRSETEVDINRIETVICGLSPQKKMSLFATAAVKEYGNVSPVQSTVGFNIYCWLTESLNADQLGRETYVKYLRELSDYSILNSHRKGYGQGAGVMRVFEFDRETEMVLEAIRRDDRFSKISEDELKAVVRAQLNKFE